MIVTEKEKAGLSKEGLLKRTIRRGDCWMWTGAKYSSGQGAYNLGRERRISAQRIAAFLWLNVPLEAEERIVPSCGFKLCCNHEHFVFKSRGEIIRQARSGIVMKKNERRGSWR